MNYDLNILKLISKLKLFGIKIRYLFIIIYNLIYLQFKKLS